MNFFNQKIEHKMKTGFLHFLSNKYSIKKIYCYPLVIRMLFVSLTACENDGLKEKVTESTQVSKGARHFLNNFGLVLKDDLLFSGITFENKYATKIVRFDHSMYDNINSKSQLISIIDNGVSVNTLPTMYLDLYEGVVVNYCFGVLINDDYYLVRFDQVSCVQFDGADHETHFYAYIDLKYKF